MSEHDVRQPVSPVSIPSADVGLAEPRARTTVPVTLKTAALEAGLHTHTCVQCGLNPAGPPVKRRYQYVPSWVYLGLMMNIVVLLILYYAGRRVVDGKLGLCADCDRADKRGRTLRGVSLVGLLAFPVVGALVGALVSSDGLLFGAAAGVVAGVAGIVAAHRSTRFDVISARLIDKKAGTTILVASPELAGVLAREAPDALA